MTLHKPYNCTAGQQRTDRPPLPLLSPGRILGWYRLPSPPPWHLQGLCWNLIVAFGYPCPAPVFLTELRELVWSLAILIALDTLLFPQQGHGHTRLGKFLVDGYVIRLCIVGTGLPFLGKQDALQLLVADVTLQRPAYALLSCCG